MQNVRAVATDNVHRRTSRATQLMATANCSGHHAQRKNTLRVLYKFNFLTLGQQRDRHFRLCALRIRV